MQDCDGFLMPDHVYTTVYSDATVSPSRSAYYDMALQYMGKHTRP